MCEAIEVTSETEEVWIHGVDDEHFERRCPACDYPIEKDDIRKSKKCPHCPECKAELPYQTIDDIPDNDWYNWLHLIKLDYDPRKCFDELKQKAIRLTASLADPRGSDIALEITKNTKGQILIKVENNKSLTYYPYQGTEIEGSYTVITFGERS